METFFLACFVGGALLTLGSLLVAHGGGGHLGHVNHGGHDLGPLTPSALVAALTWFGAAGFVLTRLGDLALPATILGALIAGVVGWYLVVRFLKLLLKGEVVMDPADYRLEGTVGQVSVRIPRNGTGEVVFSKVGARRSEAARSVDGAAIPRGTEVVITRYSDGFATVQPWAEFLAARERVAAKSGEA
jgi:membrane protein implicated in regulation of membrane protease activity